MNFSMNARVLAMVGGLVCTMLPAWAEKTTTFQSTTKQTQLIELYTSEGCSSCPPADRWFTEIGAADGLWTDYVPLAFHVTYWNHLGWRDEFAQRSFDQRQRRRAAAADSGVYTPGVFRDGDEFRGWRRLSGAPGSTGTKDAGRLSVTVDDGRVSATYAAPPNAEDPRLEIAVLANGLTSKVRAGENRGRSLQHDFVVTTLQTEDLEHDGEHWRASVLLPSVTSIDKPALAIWVVDRSGRPLQATGGWLP